MLSKFLVTIALTVFMSFYAYAQANALPKNAVIIGQSASQWGYFVNMVDLSNNELNICVFTSEGVLKSVFKTGTIIDLNKQLDRNIANKK